MLYRRFHSRKMAVTVVFLPVNTQTILQKEGLSPSNRYILYVHLIVLIFTFKKVDINTKRNVLLVLQCHMPLFRKLMIWEILNQKLL